MWLFEGTPQGCPAIYIFPSLHVSVFLIIVKGELKGQAQQTTNVNPDNV